jgi:hypothetical protein
MRRRANQYNLSHRQKMYKILVVGRRIVQDYYEAFDGELERIRFR